MKALRKINKGISAIEKVALIICFIYMTVALSIQVFGRYLFKMGFTWTEETARYIMIWSVFIGAAYIALNMEHIKVAIIEERLKTEKSKKILLLIQNIVGLIFVIIVLRYGFMQLSIAKLSVSANTGLSMLFPYMVFPVSMILLTYSFFYRIVENIVDIRHAGNERIEEHEEGGKTV